MSYKANVAEYLLDKTRIDPRAKIKHGPHALLLALRPSEEDEAPDLGLPILELFHRKAPQALDMPGENGKNLGSMPTFCDISRTKTTPSGLVRFPADPRCCLLWPCPVPRAAAGAGGRPGTEGRGGKDAAAL